MGSERQPSEAVIHYTWPNEDPKYWQMLVEYVAEAENDGDKPETFGEWIKDFTLWMENSPITPEVHRVKVLTPDENDLLGNELYSLLELNEDVAEEEDEFQHNRELRELVEREWVPK